MVLSSQSTSDTLLACLKKYRRSATEDALLFPSPTTGTVDKHLDRVIHCVIDKANQAGYAVKKPKKPCHAFRVLYSTSRLYGRNSDIRISQQLRSTCVLRTGSPTSIVPESMRLTSSRCHPQADSFSAAGLRKPPSNYRFGRPKIDFWPASGVRASHNCRAGKSARRQWDQGRFHLYGYGVNQT